MPGRRQGQREFNADPKSPHLLLHFLPLAPYTGRASKEHRGRGSEVRMKSLMKKFLAPAGLVWQRGLCLKSLVVKGLILLLFLLPLLWRWKPFKRSRSVTHLPSNRRGGVVLLACLLAQRAARYETVIRWHHQCADVCP